MNPGEKDDRSESYFMVGGSQVTLRSGGIWLGPAGPLFFGGAPRGFFKHQRLTHPSKRGRRPVLNIPMNPSDILSSLNWRYACKVFDPAKKIPAETWAALEESLVLTPSSFGMQPWKFIVIQDTELRERLVPHAWNQRQVADCSHLVVMTTFREMPEEHIDANIRRMMEVRGGTPEALMGFRNMVAGFRQSGQEKGWLRDWAKQQSYIALGQFMLAAALLEIDTCPMEGFVPAKFDEILGLAGGDYTTAVLCPAGYRSADDKYAVLPKVRFASGDVIEHR